LTGVEMLKAAAAAIDFRDAKAHAEMEKIRLSDPERWLEFMINTPVTPLSIIQSTNDLETLHEAMLRKLKESIHG